MAEESMRQECRMKNIAETWNCFIKEIEQNKLIINKYKKVFTTLNYIEHFLILASVVSRCISISAFTLIAISVGIAIGLKVTSTTKR